MITMYRNAITEITIGDPRANISTSPTLGNFGQNGYQRTSEFVVDKKS